MDEEFMFGDYNDDTNESVPDNDNQNQWQDTHDNDAPMQQYDLVIETKHQKHNCKELREFVNNYPNSFLVVPCKDCTLLRLDDRRKKQYDIMCVVSLKDALNGINK